MSHFRDKVQQIRENGDGQDVEPTSRLSGRLSQVCACVSGRSPCVCGCLIISDNGLLDRPRCVVVSPNNGSVNVDHRSGFARHIPTHGRAGRGSSNTREYPFVIFNLAS